MVQYRRDFSPGSTYFFTVALKNRQQNYLIQYIHHLGNAFRYVRNLSPYITHAIVILPDHLHVIWELPKGDANFSLRWRLIKTYFTQELIKLNVVLSKNSKGEYSLWQRRFWEHRIRNEYDLSTHINYIHYNPVKHGLVKNPSDWEFSSLKRCITQGILPVHWAEAESSGEFGEI